LNKLSVEEIPWYVVAADVAAVLREHPPSRATGGAGRGTSCSAWSLHSGWRGAFTTRTAEVTDSVPSGAWKIKTTIHRWMFFLHLSKAKEAGPAAI